MEKRLHKSGAIINARVTATISVSLVLLILGIAAFTALVTGEITRNIKENLGYDVSMAEDIDQAEVERILNIISKSPATRSASVHTPEDAAKEWEAEMGENVIELCDVNPFPTIIEVKVKEKYASVDSMAKIADYLRRDRAIDSINMNSDVIDSINANTKTLYLILSIIGVALLLISFVLINNTVHLTVYSRRFLIHTMKLVGATHAFIRRPFVKDSIVNGAVAGVIASGILSLLLPYGPDSDIIYTEKALISPLAAGLVFAALIVTGMIICAVASLFATNKYLNIEYDEMFD